MTETHVHYVTVASSETDGPAYVTFVCRADPTARCRNYPDCGCETWDEATETCDGGHADEWTHTHPSVPQPECWLESWFANEDTDYEGDYVSWSFITDETETN